MPPGAKVLIPRWIQLVGLPLILLFLWVVAGAVKHVLFLFIVALLIALFFDPIIRMFHTAHVPRGFSVAVVYIVTAILVIALLAGIGTIVVTQSKHAATTFNNYFTKVSTKTHQTAADHDVDRFQRWLDSHGLSGIHIQKRGHDLVKQIRQKNVSKYTHKIVTFLEGAAVSIGKLVFDLVLIAVISIYMLLGMSRLAAKIDRRFPPQPGSQPLIERMSHAVVSYVRGQLLVSLIIGTSVGVGMWVFGVTGLAPGANHYALLFGGWSAIAELIPYLGPILGAVPPVLYALVTHPLAAIWVLILFLFIHQIEGHIVVPNVMGSALRLHPLLIIFGLLAGDEIYGFAGILVALPFLAAGRAAWEFFGERVALEAWPATAEGLVPVEVEVEPPHGPPPAVPSPAPAVEPPDAPTQAL
ncbi:MAG TPA: AI-2E family transporter [Gaiellaceae bacterium]|nr:AI-2E family transporter [Gaiellaceae bacterium]